MERVSIIFQGRVIENNKICDDIIENIAITRKNFPQDEIILSTWNIRRDLRRELKQKINPYDIILLESQDPGPLIYQQKTARWVTNINRLIVSSREGIRRASHELVVKLRTDSRLNGPEIRHILQHRQEYACRFPRDPGYALFRHRVINGNVFARNARGYMPYLFHPGDIFLAGNQQDLYDLFDIPLADSSVFEVCFCFSIFTLMRYVPEQYIWVKYIEKVSGNMEFPGNRFASETLRERSENYYINNFIPYASEMLNFYWGKHHQVYKSKGLSSVYCFDDWKKLQPGENPSQGTVQQLRHKVKRLHIFILRVMLWIKFLPLHITFVRGVAIRVFGRRC